MEKTNLGIIGFGNMGQAIANQLKDKYSLCIFDKDTERLKASQGLNIAPNLVDLVNKADAIILAIKPQDFDCVLEGIKDSVDKKIIISIAAGITTNYLENRLNQARVIRVMPNLPAKIGQGVAGIAKGKFAGKNDLNLVKKIFDNLGNSFIVNEELINAVTAVSGSGPGFFYEFINGKYVLGDKISQDIKKEFTDALYKVSLDLGFDLNTAKAIAKATVSGSIALLKESNISPAQLRDKVASKGGTTEAGLKVLQGGGSIEDAVKAAKLRAEELTKKE